MYPYYNEFFDLGQQVIHFDLYQLSVPKDDPVHTVKKIMESLDFSKLLERYHHVGRKGYNPITLFSLLVYSTLRGVRSVDRIVELCTRDICYIWLAKGKKPKRDVFYDFMNEKLTNEILRDLHYQFVRKLQKENLVSLETLFIDGTKIEANANRYTFVWRGTLNYHLVGLIKATEKAYNRYNAFIESNHYDVKYKLSKMKMFVIEGSSKIAEKVEKNKIRKKNNQEKLSNNTIVEIDNMCPLELLKLQVNLKKISDGENIIFVNGKGQRKCELQKLYELLEALGSRLLKYKDAYEIMGTGRNSYSKTDLEATFMRMKDDHMRNGQLKPAYNVQIAVENYFVVHCYVSADRTDYNTLLPVLELHKTHLGTYPKEVTTDSGYSSEKNLAFLKEHDVESYIKLQMHEVMKTRAYKNDIGKYVNMTKVEGGYLCKNNRLIAFDGIQKIKTKGVETHYQVYSCKDCSGCELKAKCLYKYDDSKHREKNKVIKVNESWEQLKTESHENIHSEKGILNRQIRSIQTEGFFGDMKANDGFRQFNHRSTEKVLKEFMLYAFGKNIDKYHKFKAKKIEKFIGKIVQSA